MEKRHIDRRVAQMEAEGVTFHCNVHVGIELDDRRAARRATTRSRSPAAPRSRATCRSPAATSTASISPWSSCRSRTAASATSRSATSCRSSPAASTSSSSAAATPAPTASAPSNRQGALSVTQLEIMPRPPEKEDKALTWPNWPLKMRTSSSQEEGAERDFAVMTAEVHRRERPGEGAALRPRRRQDEADRRAPSSCSRPTSCCSPWASSARCRTA